LKVPGSPFGIAVRPDGRIVVGDWNGDQIHEIDSVTGNILHSGKIGKAPAHLALTVDGRFCVAAAREADQVAIFNADALDDRTTVSVGRAPFALANSHDGQRAAVANAQAGTVSQIDLASGKIVNEVRVGAMPYGVAFLPDDKALLVTNQQSGTVSILVGDTAAQTVKVGNYPEGLAIAPDGKLAYVANWFSDDVSIIDIAAAKEVARIKVPGGPRAVVAVPEEARRP